MRLGIGLSIGQRFGAPPGGPSEVNPASLSPTGLWLAGDYAAGDWTPTGAGAHLLEGTNQPDAATGDVPDFVPANNDTLSSTDALSSLLGTNGVGEVFAAVSIDAVATTSPANIYAADCIWIDSAQYAGFFLWKDGTHYWISFYMWDSAARKVDLDLGTSIPSGTICVQARKVGGTLYARLSGGAWQSAACGNIGSAAGTLKLGKQSAGPSFDGRISGLGFYAAALADADSDGVYAWAQNHLGAT